MQQLQLNVRIPSMIGTTCPSFPLAVRVDVPTQRGKPPSRRNVTALHGTTSESVIPSNMEHSVASCEDSVCKLPEVHNAINTVIPHSRALPIYYPWQKTQRVQALPISKSVLQMTINIPINIPRARMHQRFQMVQEEGPKPETLMVQFTALNGFYPE